MYAQLRYIYRAKRAVSDRFIPELQCLNFTLHHITFKKLFLVAYE